MRALRGETEAQPTEVKAKAKPKYRTAQEDLRDAQLRKEAALMADETEEAVDAKQDEADARRGDANAESSGGEDGAGKSTIILLWYPLCLSIFRPFTRVCSGCNERDCA